MINASSERGTSRIFLLIAKPSCSDGVRLVATRRKNKWLLDGRELKNPLIGLDVHEDSTAQCDSWYSGQANAVLHPTCQE